MKIKFQCSKIKSDGSTAVSTRLYIISGCLCSKKKEVSSCDRSHIFRKVKNIYYLVLYS